MASQQQHPAYMVPNGNNYYSPYPSAITPTGLDTSRRRSVCKIRLYNDKTHCNGSFSSDKLFLEKSLFLGFNIRTESSVHSTVNQILYICVFLALKHFSTDYLRITQHQQLQRKGKNHSQLLQVHVMSQLYKKLNISQNKSVQK